MLGVSGKSSKPKETFINQPMNRCELENIVQFFVHSFIPSWKCLVCMFTLRAHFNLRIDFSHFAFLRPTILSNIWLREFHTHNVFQCFLLYFNCKLWNRTFIVFGFSFYVIWTVVCLKFLSKQREEGGNKSVIPNEKYQLI